MQKKSKFHLVLNSVQSNEDPTLLNATFIVHDFDKSWNGQVVTKEVALENAYTLKNKPLVAKYYPVEEDYSSTDGLGSHEQFLGVDRYGNPDIKTDTVPIGVITSEGYLLTIDSKEVLAVDGVLWRERYSDVCELLLEWFQRGIKIISSVEYLYKNFTRRDGIEYIESPIIYSGHCLLNSEQRGDHVIIAPAYDVSQLLSFNDLNQFNRLVAQAINQNDREEDLTMFKKVCELSHDDIRSLLYGTLSDVLSDEEYYDSWIVEVYEDRFIYQTWIPEVGVKFYEVTYSKSDDEIIHANFEDKVEVREEREWVKDETLTVLEEQLNESVSKVKQLTDTVTSLNTKILELESYKEKYEKDQYEYALNEQMTFYEEKFDAVSAIDTYQSDEVKNLIKLSLNENEEGIKAKLQLNSMILELVKPTIEKANSGFKESANKRGRLIDTESDFKSRYSI